MPSFSGPIEKRICRSENSFYGLFSGRAFGNDKCDDVVAKVFQVE